MPDWTVGEEGRQAEWRGEGVHRLAGRRGPRRPQEGPSLPEPPVVCRNCQGYGGGYQYTHEGPRGYTCPACGGTGHDEQAGPSLPADVLAEEAVTLVCPLCLGPVRVPPTAPDLELLRWRGLACDTCVALA